MVPVLTREKGSKLVGWWTGHLPYASLLLNNQDLNGPVGIDKQPGAPADRYLTTPMTVDLAANTAISFSTTTTWQAYGGETTFRYLTQMLGLVSQNFLAGASGLALGIAFIRGFARERSGTLGNFWVDLVRALLWVLVPLALVGSLILVWQGVPLNLAHYTEAHTLQGGVQNIAQGPSLYGSALRLRLVHGEQWTKHGGPERQQRLLQRDHCTRHVGGTVRPGRAGVGPGWAVCRAGP